MITDAGQIALDHASGILAEIEGVERSLEEHRGIPVGRICVSAPHILGQRLLGPIIADFLTAHPGCHLTLDLSNRRVDLIEERVDFAIRVGLQGDTDFIVRPVGEVGVSFDRASRPERHHTTASRAGYGQARS